MGSPRVKPAAINFVASGDNIVVASSTRPVSVQGVAFTVAGATNITFKNGSTAQSGAIQFTGAGASMTLPLSDLVYFFAVPGNDFIINSSQAVQVSGTLWYTSG